MEVTLVREEPPLRATSAWVRAASRTICLSRFSSACWTCHSCASTPLSPSVRAKVSGVLAVIVLVFILHLLQSLPRQLNFRGRRLLGLFHEGVKHENALCARREIEHSKLAIFAMQPQFRNARSHRGHSPRQWHARLLTHLKQEKRLTDPVANLARERPNCIAGFRMKYNRPHNSSVSKPGHAATSLFSCRSRAVHYRLSHYPIMHDSNARRRSLRIARRPARTWPGVSQIETSVQRRNSNRRDACLSGQVAAAIGERCLRMRSGLAASRISGPK